MELLLAKIPAGGSHSRLGTVVTVDGLRMVNVDGNNLTATWADPLVVDDGDPVTVRIEGAGIGAKAVVSARATEQPRPRTGEVMQVPAGSPTITVRAGGVNYTTEPVYPSPTQGDKVHLDWGAGKPRAIGKVSLIAAPPAPVVTLPPPPPVVIQSGTQNASPTLSRTYWGPGGWGSYAGDGNKVHQGSYGGATVTGAWFYGQPFRSLIGRGITRIQFRTGQRLGIGSYGETAAFQFYAHTNPGQPAGDTNRVQGPYVVNVPPGQGAAWIDLPLAFADTLVNGGGIALAGGPYAGMQGTTSASPDSGALRLDWTY